MADLKGKIAIVTGAGRGIGKGTALELAKEGVKVVLAGITERNIGLVKAEIDAMGGQAFPVQTDISNGKTPRDWRKERWRNMDGSTFSSIMRGFTRRMSRTSVSAPWR